MTEQEFEELIAFGREQQGVEFKGCKVSYQKVIRAILSMANRRDGGLVIIGVEEDDQGRPTPKGLSERDLKDWHYDKFADKLSTYADPSVDFHLEVFEYQGSKFVIITVSQFEDIPVLCKRDHDKILRKGACYVRSRRKPESVEIPSQAEMRDLLDLATIQALRRYLALGNTAGLDFSRVAQTTNDQKFENQLRDSIEERKESGLYDKILSRGYWQVIIRPTSFKARRIPDIASLRPIIEKNRIRIRGWHFPQLDPKNNPPDLDWFGQESNWQHYKSTWQFFRSGQFFYLSAMPIDWRDESSLSRRDKDWQPNKLLGIYDTIGTLTEIFEFATRLALSDAGGDSMHVQIIIGRLKNRVLYDEKRPFVGFLRGEFQISIEKFPYEKNFPTTELVSESKDIALEVAADLFKRFGWNFPNIETLREWQKELRF